MQRFYFLTFEHHAVLSNVISNLIAFEKECSNIKLESMALSRQELASKLAKKTQSRKLRDKSSFFSKLRLIKD